MRETLLVARMPKRFQAGRWSLRSTLLLLTVFLAFQPLFAQLSQDSLTFIHLSDTHLCDLVGRDAAFVKIRSHHQPSAGMLSRFLATRPQEVGADAVVITGDLVDFFATEPRVGKSTQGQIEVFSEAIKASPVPLWLALGNHDIGNLTLTPTREFRVSRHQAEEARASWIRTVACFRNGTYYSIVRVVGKTTYRLIFLDNDFSLSTGRRAGAYDCYVDRFQLDWLQYQLRLAANEIVILFMHMPVRNIRTESPDVATTRGDTGQALTRLLNQQFIRVLDENRTVTALVTGHTHKNVVEGISLPSGRTITQIQTGDFRSDRNNWRTIELTSDSIRISKPGAADLEEAIVLPGK